MLAQSLSTGPVRGWRVIGSSLYVVSGNSLYSLSTSLVITLLTSSIATNTGLVSLSDNGVQLGIADGTNIYCYTLVTGSYFQAALNNSGSFGIITDANCPSGNNSLSFLDGRTIANKPNTRYAYVSEYYDLTHWTNVSSLPTYNIADNGSDLLLACDVLNGAVVLWSQLHMEFLQDVGSAPNPFARINGATQTWGLAAVNSRAFLNNTMIFLAQNPQGTLQVMMLDGYIPKRVSTSDVEDLISGFSTWSDATALTYIVAGHPMYQLNFPTANRSFLFDSLTSVWQEVQTGLDLITRDIGNIGISFNSYNYVADFNTSNIYQLSTTSFTDNGTPVKRQIVSKHIEMGGNMFGIDELYLDMETGVGLQQGQGSNPQISLEVSKDGGRTWGVQRWASMGLVGQYRAPRVIWRRLGMARDFVFRFTMTDPVKFTIIRGAVSIRGQEGMNG